MLTDLLNHLEQDLAASRQVIPCFKSAISAARETLISAFAEGAPVEQLVTDHATFMDGVLRLAWNRFEWQENRRSWRKSRVALVAVGGYGRSELLPHSDIDLMILLERAHYRRHQANIQSFTTLLWDIGLEVGHSVRTVAECKSQASSDVTVMTALLESRILVGDQELLDRVDHQIAKRKIWSSKKFYAAKKAEQQDRHSKSEHTEYSLEPNVKSSPGGLRDIQTLTWVARRHFELKGFAGLLDSGILTETEFGELLEARNHLWKIRFALHVLTGRDENRLLFEHQQSLAASFGYSDGDQLAVEQFMQAYYRTATRVKTINDTLLQHFEEVIVQAGTRLRVRPVNKRFQIANNLLEVTSPNVFEERPSALLEMFVIVGSDDSIEGFRAGTIRLARAHVHLIDDAFRNDPDNAALFIELLGCNNHLFTQLRRMNRWGILGAYLPEFGRVLGQMQFDLFHIYTVDAHTLQVVRNMRRFRYKNNEQEFPVAAHIHPRLPRVELLYIAGLYHDIAKGLGGDHSELGISIARAFCERHNLPTWDTNLVCWLVQHHLVMSTTAQRKDIQDPEVIFEFAELVGDQVRLDYLYALTVADINATNPTLWNGWKASLMRQLYSETKKALRHGLEKPVDRAEYIQDIRQQALLRLEEKAVTTEAVEALWNQVDDDYFVRESVNDIVWHTEGILAGDVEEKPVVLIRDDRSRRSDEGFTQIFIHTQDRSELFIAIVNAIDHLGLNIVDAGIATSAADLTFNTFTVLSAEGQPLGEKPQRIEKVSNTIREFIAKRLTQPTVNRRIPRALKHFSTKSQVNITQHPRLAQTAVEITAPDRPGLLTTIAAVFAERGISLVSARITTLGDLVEDIFYITDADNQPINDPATIANLREQTVSALEERIEQLAS
ncbi:MAG: [protein-PII] uridylyltransferase [Gammaproteobacteria bacterium]